MTSKPTSFKAHTKCATGGGDVTNNPTAVSPIHKKNLTTPYKCKQTPVHRRNVSRIQISTVKTIKKHSSCQNLTVIQEDKDIITQCNKSKSYENLLSVNQVEKREAIIRTRTKTMGENEGNQVSLEIVENKVIKEACTAFLLNAWRHRRQEVADIKKKISALENQTTDLRVQIMSLWQLLESEKARLAQANLKAMQQHVVAEDAVVNSRNLSVVNASQQKEIAELHKEIALLKTERNNQKNELIVAKQENFSLHNQMDKERVKVTKLRDDKKILLDKVQAAEAESKRKSALLAQNETEQKEKRDAHLALLQNIQEKNLLVDTLTAEKNSLSAELGERERRNDILEQKIGELEQIIIEKEKEIEMLKRSTQTYMSVSND